MTNHAAFRRLLAGTLCACALVCATAAARAQGVRRFAVVVGNDRGGSDTRPLLYAREDARKIHEVFVRMGGVAADDALLLLDARAQELEAALAAVDARARQAAAGGTRTSLVVYYSGHAKDGDLRLGDTRLPLSTLRARVAASPADVRLAIIDSCRSGAVTRTKGARLAPAFDVESTGNDDARGTVFLTSSSFDEDSQESDTIAGSYFSHHLASGLRGAADRSGDGRVTLSEAYAYAYARTVADTADSMAGAQHPTFSYDLKGNGDLVLSEYGALREGLHVPAEAPAGTYFLVDDRGVIAAEFAKEAGRARRIAVRAGRYKVKRRLPDKLRIGLLDVPAGALVTFDEARLRDAPFSDDPVKGALREAAVRYSLSGGLHAQSFLDGATREGLFPPTGLFALEVGVADFLRAGYVVQADLALGGTRGTLERPTASYGFRFGETSLGAAVLRQWSFQDGKLRPYFGPRVAFLFFRRVFDDELLPVQTYSTFSPGLAAGLHWSFADHWSLAARSRVGWMAYTVDEHRWLTFLELGTAVVWDF